MASPDPTTVVGLVALVLGGVGTKAFDFLVGRKKQAFDIDAARREELRKDLDRYRAATESAEKERDSWRNHAFKAMAEVTQWEARGSSLDATFQSQGAEHEIKLADQRRSHELAVTELRKSYEREISELKIKREQLEKMGAIQQNEINEMRRHMLSGTTRRGGSGGGT